MLIAKDGKSVFTYHSEKTDFPSFFNLGKTQSSGVGRPHTVFEAVVRISYDLQVKQVFADDFKKNNKTSF